MDSAIVIAEESLLLPPKEIILPSAQQAIGAFRPLDQPTFDVGPKLQRVEIEEMLHFCIHNGAEDLYLLAGAPWAVQWSGCVHLLGTRELYIEELQDVLAELSGNRNAALQIQQGEDMDFNFSIRNPVRLPGQPAEVLRFRVNATGAMGPNSTRGMEIVFRPAGNNIPTMDQLGIPKDLQKLLMPKTGVILVCGPTGSGKTTYINGILRGQATRKDGQHILVFGAPLEQDLNIIPDRTGLIAQSEIGPGTYGGNLADWMRAVRNALRRHPTVVYFTEARDALSIEGVLLIAQSGHATYTTTHTASTHMAINRLGDNFQGADRVRVMKGYLENTRGIVHQRLLKTPSGIGRSPVRAWVTLTQDMRTKLIRESNLDALPSMIKQFTEQEGRGLWDDAQEQYKAGKISDDEMDSLRDELATEEF